MMQMGLQVRIQDLCKGGGGKRDFANIVQRSRGGGKNLDLKIRSQGGGGRPLGPPSRSAPGII